MSLAVMGWAWQQDIAPAARKLVLLALADYARDCGHAWPQPDMLGKRCGLQARMIRYHLSAMTKDGILERETLHREDGRPWTRYRVQWSAMVPCNGLHGSPAIQRTSPLQSDVSPLPSIEPLVEPLVLAQGGLPPVTQHGLRDGLHAEKPEWIATLYTLKAVTPLTPKSESALMAWAKAEGFKTDMLNQVADSLAGKWPGPPRSPYRDVNRTYRAWVRRERRNGRTNVGRQAGPVSGTPAGFMPYPNIPEGVDPFAKPRAAAR